MSRATALLARSDFRAALADHVMGAWPREACALLVEGSQGPEIICTENIVDAMHAFDPESFPRDARTSFVLDVRTIVAVERRGCAVIGIVHSHCGVGAYFSDEDVRGAMAPCGTVPWYPDIEHVVIDAQADGMRGFRAFGWCRESGGFVETGAGTWGACSLLTGVAEQGSGAV